ncbi:MAG: hypothetical protein ACRDG3_12005 [Tepidiformaceae bacterium]
MAFTVSDYQDLVKLLRDHPEWREELRREILDDEFLRLPDYVRQNSLDILQNSADIRQNSADIRQNSADIRDLQKVVAELVAETREFRLASEARFSGIDRDLQQIKNDVAQLKGIVAESKWREHAAGRFGKRIRRLRVVEPRDLTLFEDADQADAITPEQALAIRKVDLLLEGIEGRGAAQQEALLVVEISVGIEKHDVDRAAQRAEILRTIGYNAHGVVAWIRIAELTEQYATQLGVDVILESSRDAQQSA